MNEDWRLHVTLHKHGFAHRLTELLGGDELEHDLGRSFQDRVVVSVDGNDVFCYTGTRDQAEAAEQAIRGIAAKHEWTLDSKLTHWHPTAEEWEDPDVAMPDTPAAAEEEREDRIESEREESSEQGYPEYEVRVECTSRDEATEVSSKLEAEGIEHVHRHSYLLVGATDEESAQALAERLKGEVPSDATVTVELNRRAVYDSRPLNPFWILGGLAG
jgi:hypothetical protein